jgi:hypothetical protein
MAGLDFKLLCGRCRLYISVQPGRQALGTVIRREMGLGAGPFPQRGLDDALGLAIGFSGV